MSSRKEKYAKKKNTKLETTTPAAASSQPENTPSTSRLYTKPPASETNGAGFRPEAIEYIPAQQDDFDLRVPGQDWMVLAYVAPEGTAVKSKQVLVKISGGFPTEAAAEIQAKKIREQAHHRLISTYVVPLYQWLSVPMPEYCKLTCQQKYVDQEMLEKIMQGNWHATEESRKKVLKREKAAREQNLRRMRAINGPDYQLPTRSPEEEAKRQAQEKSMLESKPDAEESKVTSMDACMYLLKYMTETKTPFPGMKTESSSDVVTSSSSDAPQAEEKPDAEKTKNPTLSEEMKKFLIGYKAFMDTQAASTPNQ